MFDGDGRLRHRTEFWYDRAGREVRRDHCSGESWIPASVRSRHDPDWTWTCVHEGSVVRTWRPDGYDERDRSYGRDRRVRATTDARGNVVREDIDDDGDGTFETLVVQTWQCP
jgi:hypothetical protein